MYDDEFWKTGDLAYTPKFTDSKIYLGDIFSSIGYPDTQFDDILMEECIHQSQFHSNLASKIGYLYYDIVTAIWTSPGAIPGGYYENSPSENVAKTLVNQIQTKAGR